MLATIALLVAIVLIALGAFFYQRGNSDKTAPRAWSLFEWLIPGRRAEQTPSLMRYLLGFDEPRTFLVLFLNNMEMRPAGGFIGTYALVEMDNGRLTDLFIEGTELLDARAPALQVTYPPPKPLQDYLKITEWQFRDANWSPDFAESAAWALWLYKIEGGRAADRIDGVIGITATVLDELVNLTGPLTANDVTLRPGSAADDLEYEVEFAFASRGIPLKERKAILHDLGKAMARRLVGMAPMQWKNIIDTFERLGREKHLMIYSVYPELQEVIRGHNWDGEMQPFAGDGFMVVDANLGALKTDHAMRRYYNYTVRPSASPAGKRQNEFEGTLTARYEHRGAYDWRTSRYRSYTRVYLPEDAVVTNVEGFVDPEHPEWELPPDRGSRAGMQVLGGYVRVGSGETQDIVVTYTLPPRVAKQVTDGVYTFSVQKQLGLIDPQLTLDLDFGTKRHTETRVLKEDYALTLPL